MPGENLSRDEARERAAILSVERYDVALDVRSAVGTPDGSGPRTFRSTTVIDFRCARPGASTFADLIAPAVTSVRLNGRELDPAAVFDGTRIALDGLAERNTLVVDAALRLQPHRRGPAPLRRPGGRRGLPLHAVRAGRRAPGVRQLRTARPQGAVHLPGDRPRGLDGAEQRRGRRRAGAGRGRRADGAVRADAADLDVHHGGRRGPVPRGARPLLAHATGRRARWTSRCRRCAALAGPALRRGRRSSTVTKQGLDFFHENFDYPYPFGKYDQAFVPEYNLGAMENPGLVTFREEFVFRGKVTRAAVRAPGERHPARDGAHVVRRPGHHALVGRPVAQGVLRRLHGRLRAGRGDAATPRAGSPSPTAARRGPTAPTSCPPPTRWSPTSATWRTPSSTSTASRTPRAPRCSSSWWPTSAGTPSWRRPGATSSGTPTATPRSADLLSVLGGDLGPRHGRLVAVLAGDGGRQLADPAGGPTTRRTGSPNWRSLQTADARAPRTAPAPGRGGPVPARRRRRRWSGTRGPRRTSAGPRTVVAELAGQPRPDLVLVNDDDLTYCKIRFDEALAGHRCAAHLGDLDRPAGPGAGLVGGVEPDQGRR